MKRKINFSASMVHKNPDAFITTERFSRRVPLLYALVKVQRALLKRKKQKV